MTFVNLAAYKFVDLDDVAVLQGRLKEQCLALRLKGTILLGTEGINFTLAGTRVGIDGFKEILAADSRFTDMPYKESFSHEQPFRRMLVKIKKEIVTMGVPSIHPASKPAPRIAPKVLKQWLDEQRDVVLLDTRNDYEVRLGTFTNALDIGIHHFRDFPQAVAQLDPALKTKPIVTFCTGGIRCEKAAPLLIEQGFQEVYQLDGGILKYFEECAGQHYQGDCFVFDDRVAIDKQLQETGTVQCAVCASPVMVAEQQLSTYIPQASCPACYVQP